RNGSTAPRRHSLSALGSDPFNQFQSVSKPQMPAKAVHRSASREGVAPGIVFTEFNIRGLDADLN
ncbi:MAG: hypothetical protein ABI664_12565, partial [bacterium]